MNGERINLRYEPSEERNWSTANESDFPMTGVEKGMSCVRLQAHCAAQTGRAQHVARTSRARGRPLHCRYCVLGLRPLYRALQHIHLGAQPAWNCRHRWLLPRSLCWPTLSSRYQRATPLFLLLWQYDFQQTSLFLICFMVIFTVSYFH